MILLGYTGHVFAEKYLFIRYGWANKFFHGAAKLLGLLKNVLRVQNLVPFVLFKRRISVN